MTNKKFSDLPVTTTFTLTDIMAIVQGGVTKQIAASDFNAAIIPSYASTSANGVVKIATNAQVATATSTLLMVTPANLRSGAANGAFDTIVMNTATGSAPSAGGINATQYLVNGVALPTTIQATPTSMGIATTLAIVVDFTTYSSYKLVFSRGNYTSTCAIDASSNAGVGYTGFTLQGFSVATTTVASITAIPTLSGSGTGEVEMTITQATTGGSISIIITGTGGTTTSFVLGGASALSAACNRIKFTTGGFVTGGFYTLIPLARR